MHDALRVDFAFCNVRFGTNPECNKSNEIIKWTIFAHANCDGAMVHFYYFPLFAGRNYKVREFLLRMASYRDALEAAFNLLGSEPDSVEMEYLDTQIKRNNDMIKYLESEKKLEIEFKENKRIFDKISKHTVVETENWPHIGGEWRPLRIKDKEHGTGVLYIDDAFCNHMLSGFIVDMRLHGDDFKITKKLVSSVMPCDNNGWSWMARLLMKNGFVNCLRYWCMCITCFRLSKCDVSLALEVKNWKIFAVLCQERKDETIELMQEIAKERPDFADLVLAKDNGFLVRDVMTLDAWNRFDGGKGYWTSEEVESAKEKWGLCSLEHQIRIRASKENRVQPPPKKSCSDTWSRDWDTFQGAERDADRDSD